MRVKSWGIAAYLALLLERLSRAFQPQPTPTPAQFRPFEGVRREIRLDVAYHPAKGPKGYVLIPKDSYYRESEDLLSHL